ncbi:MAG: HAD family hydrolase [Candidatus Hodarchaeota archaeon]
MIKSLKLIIFDLDDTLIRSNIDYSRIRYSIAELFNPPLSDDIIKNTPILKLLTKLKKTHPKNYIEGKRRMITLEKSAAEFATVLQGAERIPEILSKLNIESAILTNNSKDTITLYLTKPQFEFLRKFEIFTREDFSKAKPDPEGIIKIIEKYKLSPISVVYIGDSYIDAIAAQKVGIRFIHFYSREINQNLFPEPPYATLTHWADFEELLLQN